MDARAGRHRRRRCRRTGRCRTPRTTATCCAHAVPAAVRRRGIEPDAGDRHRHRLHRLHRAAGARATARRCASCRSCATARTPTPKLWKHHAAQPQADRINALAARARRAVARPATAGRSPRSGSSPRRCSCWRRTRRSTTAPSAGSRPPTGSSGSSCGAETRNACTAGYKGIYQDGHYPSRDYLAALNPGFADFVDDKLTHPLSAARRAGRRADRRRPRRGPACPRASPSRSATWTRTSPRRPRTRSSPARWSRSWAPRPAT